jgi:hypothetical protein
MSARELHRYVRSSGKKNLTFRDIKPFVEKNKQSLIIPARVLAHMVGKKRNAKEDIPDKHLMYMALLNESGILIHPLDLKVCLEIGTNPLRIRDIPFKVYFNQLDGDSRIGGTFLNLQERKLSSVFLSLSVAIHLISSYLSSNNLESININRIGRRFLMQRHDDGSIVNLPKEKVVEIANHFIGTKLMELEINRLFAANSAADYMDLVEAVLNSIAIHETAHVLHSESGIIGKGGLVKEEERAYLTEMAYGNLAFSFAYLPTRNKEDPNCMAGREIIKNIFERIDLSKLLNATNDQIRNIAKELLDEEFVKSFGAHHDQIIPILEIHRVRKHRFFNDEHLPMIESLRYLPKKAA